MVTYELFKKVDMRVGKVIEVEDFPEARVPAYKLKIDFGKVIGVKQSSAQITDLYSKEDLLGRQVVCVINFEPKKIAGFMSEVLVMGAGDEQDRVVLLEPNKEIRAIAWSIDGATRGIIAI